MKEGYLTKGEALSFLGMNQHTFDKYVQNFGFKSEHIGRCTYFLKEDIERLDNALGNRVPQLIKMLEQLTGCKVNLVKQ